MAIQLSNTYSCNCYSIELAHRTRFCDNWMSDCVRHTIRMCTSKTRSLKARADKEGLFMQLYHCN